MQTIVELTVFTHFFPSGVNWFDKTSFHKNIGHLGDQSILETLQPSAFNAILFSTLTKDLIRL